MKGCSLALFVYPWEEPQVWYGLQPLTKEKQESVRKKEEEEDKHCYQEERNVFTTEVVNICNASYSHTLLLYVV